MVGSEVLGWRGWGRTDPCMWGSPFFSLRAWDGGRFLWGRVDGGRMCEGGGEVRDRANPMLVGVGDRLFARGADEGRSSTRGELVRGGRVFFPLFSPYGAGWELSVRTRCWRRTSGR